MHNRKWLGGSNQFPAKLFCFDHVCCCVLWLFWTNLSIAGCQVLLPKDRERVMATIELTSKELDHNAETEGGKYSQHS